jgi:beta-glucosidase
MNQDLESEGFDRKHIDLPGATNELIERVLAVNQRTIVVNNSGMPVAMPWIDQAPTVLQAFFGGNEAGSGLADVLFGRRDPSGKLSISFPCVVPPRSQSIGAWADQAASHNQPSRQLSDSPSYPIFPGESGKSPYNEGIYVGYRHPAFRTVFPFGHGLT